MTAAPHEQSDTLRYGVDDHPPHWLAAALGLQVVVVILAGIVLVPIIVLKAAGASLELMTWAVFAALIVSGITTILQARPVGPMGAGYVLFMGTSGAFISVSTMAVERGGLSLLASLVIVSSLIQFLLAARLSWLRRIITPTVGGTVVMLIAVTVAPISFEMLGSVPAHVPATSMAGPVTAGATFVVILAVSLFSRGGMRLWAPLLGVIAGCSVGYAVGIMDLTQLERARWVGLPNAAWPGIDWSLNTEFFMLLPGFVIVTVVGAIETFGDGIAIQRVSSRTQQPVDFKAVQGAINADSVGNLLSGLACTLPNTTYSTSVSVVDITGVAARRVGVYGGLIMMVFAFFPKVSAALQAIPDAVTGAYVLILIVLLFAHGLRLVSEGGLTYENGFVVGLALWLGIGFQNQSIFPELLPEAARMLLDNGMTAGGIVAILLTAILALKERSRERITLAASTRALVTLQDFLVRVAAASGWDKLAIDRLQLVGEEALLFLVERGSEVARRHKIRVCARRMNDVIELEFFCGPDAENLERRVGELGEAAPMPEEAGLRILRHLTTHLRHEQFRDQDCLTVVVDSRPLA